MAMRKCFVGGNWKCNLMRNQVETLVKQLNGVTVNTARNGIPDFFLNSKMLLLPQYRCTLEWCRHL